MYFQACTLETIQWFLLRLYASLIGWEGDFTYGITNECKHQLGFWNIYFNLIWTKTKKKICTDARKGLCAVNPSSSGV